MKSRGLMMLLIAVIAGLLAVVVAARWLQQQGSRKTLVVVAGAELAHGARLAAGDLRAVDWPAASMPPGTFNDATLLVGRVLLDPLQPGEPVLETRLAPVGARGGLSALVPEGKRAMTVRVNDVVGVAGFALPGTFVDVLVSTQADGARQGDRERAISKIVLERILVMAVAQEADRGDTKPKVVNAVTLEVTPEQAERLDLARSVGTLSLVLRNQTETRLLATAGVTKAQLLGLGDPSRPAPPAVRVRMAPRPAAVPAPAVALHGADCVEVIRGLSKVTECF